ncbi:hypothetical protein [Borrelia puertoricensis]|uniref:hypothetical protein n=1 Tax=Borrelia puertoricensis TaxID=2756107 RepID=UPI0032218C5E
MNSLEQQITNIESNLKKDIEFTKVEFKRDIANLDIKIDSVEKNLLKEIQDNNAVLLKNLIRGIESYI